MPGPKTSLIGSAPGVALAVHDWGGTGAPVLLAHPTGFHGRVWEPIAHRLIAAGRRAISFDFRGHGDSDAPEEDYSWQHFGDDVLAVVDHFRLAGDPTLLAAGHSKGAAALLLAELARPATFARIWAYEPIMVPAGMASGPRRNNALAGGAAKRRNAWASIDEAYARYASRPPLNVMTAESLRAYVDYGLRDRGDGVFELKCGPEIEARVYSMGPSHGLFERLAEINSSVLVAAGENTDGITPDIAAMIETGLPHATVEIWRGHGHFGPQADPDRALASMLAFADTT